MKLLQNPELALQLREFRRLVAERRAPPEKSLPVPECYDFRGEVESQGPKKRPGGFPGKGLETYFRREKEECLVLQRSKNYLWGASQGHAR